MYCFLCGFAAFCWSRFPIIQTLSPNSKHIWFLGWWQRTPAASASSVTEYLKFCESTRAMRFSLPLDWHVGQQGSWNRLIAYQTEVAVGWRLLGMSSAWAISVRIHGGWVWGQSAECPVRTNLNGNSSAPIIRLYYNSSKVHTEFLSRAFIEIHK